MARLAFQSRSLYEGLVAAGYDFVTGVPDSAFRELIASLEAEDPPSRYSMATREDIAVGLACGATLSGSRSLVFMESSGFGTALDALTSLAKVYQIPLVLLVAWAGYKGRDVPHHNSIGEPFEAILEALQFKALVLPLEWCTDDVSERLERAWQLSVEHGTPVCVLLIPPELASP